MPIPGLVFVTSVYLSKGEEVVLTNIIRTLLPSLTCVLLKGVTLTYVRICLSPFQRSCRPSYHRMKRDWVSRMSVPGFPSVMSSFVSQGEERLVLNICLSCLSASRRVKRRWFKRTSVTGFPFVMSF